MELQSVDVEDEQDEDDEESVLAETADQEIGNRLK